MDAHFSVGWETLPAYRCHKVVRAMQVADIEPLANGSFVVHGHGPGIGPVIADPEFMRRHNPQIGGYIVLYDDGYQSYSPAKAFEVGYERV